MPRKLWTTEDVYSADLMTYVQNQVTTICTSSTRPTQVSVDPANGVPIGHIILETDTSCVVTNTGATWKAIDTFGAWTSTSRPPVNLTTDVYEGLRILETDTGNTMILRRTTVNVAVSGGNPLIWVPIVRHTEATYTPAWVGITTPNSVNSGKYWETGRVVTVQINGTWSPAVNSTAAPLTFSLPKNALYTANACWGNFYWRSGGGSYTAADAMWLPSASTAALASSGLAYIPASGANVMEVVGILNYLAA